MLFTPNKEIIKFKKNFIIEKKHGNTLPCIRCVVVLKENTYNEIYNYMPERL